MVETADVITLASHSTFIVHFDLPSHAIPLFTFVRTAEDAATIIGTLNLQVFAGQLEYELLVLPPAQGSFKSRIALAILAGWGAVWSFTESDIGKAFIEGLTTQPPAYWAKEIGEELRGRVSTPSVEPAPEEDGIGIDSLRCLTVGRILVESTKSFLQRDAESLEKAGVTIARFREAYVARNDFYDACFELRDLQAIGFDEYPVFPINRTEFSSLQVILPPPKEETDDPWNVEIVDLKVTSPNWEKEDRQRFWKGRDRNGRDRLFRIDDEHFWELVKASHLDTHVNDTMKVQWAYRGKPSSPKNIRVLTVLQFNGRILAEPLEEDALKAILGRSSMIDEIQGDLFN